MGSLLTNTKYMPIAVPSSLRSEEGLIPIDTRRMIHLRASPTIADDEIPPIEALTTTSVAS